MRIRVMSDLHLEFYEDPQACGIFGDVACDVVVLAGDIALGTRAIRWAADSFPDTPVVYVLGNHEYYGHDAAELLPRARSAAQSSGVHLLENDEVRIGGVRFLGCTLWTDFAAGGDVEGAQRIADGIISDFRSVSHRGRRLTPRDIVLWHQESASWLRRQLDPSDPAVVVTHFPPTLRTVNPRFGAGDALTPYFHCNLEHLMGNAVPLWIHGHSHHSATERIDTPRGSTLVCSNQLGYPGEGVAFMTDYVLQV